MNEKINKKMKEKEENFRNRLIYEELLIIRNKEKNKGRWFDKNQPISNENSNDAELGESQLLNNYNFCSGMKRLSKNSLSHSQQSCGVFSANFFASRPSISNFQIDNAAELRGIKPNLKMKTEAKNAA